MAFTPLSTDLNTIQGLATRPNKTDGLTAAQLKAKFDYSVNLIQSYLNGTLIAELGSTTDSDSGADNIGATALAGGTAATVQGILEELDELIKAIPDKTETLTNKTLTSPKLNEDVAVTSTATELNKLHGAEVSTAEINLLTGKTGTLWTSENDGPTSGMSAQFAAEATKLAVAKRVNGVSFNGTADIKFVGECNTAANVGTKLVAFTSDYSPAADTLFGVRFLYGNTASGFTLTVAGQTKNVGFGDYQVGPLYLRPLQVYLFAVNQYNNRYDLVGYESQGNVVSLQDTGNYYTSSNAEGAFQEVGAHLVSLDSLMAARYTKTEMQTSGSSLMHWDNITGKPNFADDHWKAPVNTTADLPLTGNKVNDLRLVANDGDGKGAGYQCIATTGTLEQQWLKVLDVDWMSEEQTRIAQENARQSAEESRVTSENLRASNETNRELKEGQRNAHEQDRESAETSRISAEGTRVTAENLRKSNELDRQTYEARRAFIEPYNAGHSYFAQQKVTYEGSTYQALNNMSAGTHLPTDTAWWICIAQKGDNTTAANVSYDNTTSGLASNTTQGAIDETDAKIASVETALTGEIGATNSNLSQLSDSVTAIVNGALFKAVYDSDNSGSVDKADLASNAELLGGKPPTHYQALMVNDIIEGGQKTVQALIDRILENIYKAYSWAVLETKYDSWTSFEALELSWNDINEGGY